MSELADFLLARIAEDEAVARGAAGAPRYDRYGNNAADEMVTLAENEGAREVAVIHASRYRPQRILAECEAKRRIVWRAVAMQKEAEEASYDDLNLAALKGQAYALTLTLRMLALPYTDHPDYSAPGWGSF